jgi:hypothetical protein
MIILFTQQERETKVTYEQRIANLIILSGWFYESRNILFNQLFEEQERNQKVYLLLFSCLLTFVPESWVTRIRRIYGVDNMQFVNAIS